MAVVQAALIKLGFLAGDADGKFGRKTLRAIENFQTENGVPDSGEIDRETLHALDRALVANNVAQATNPTSRFHSAAPEVLRSGDPTSAEYEETVSAWPEQSAIWSALNTRRAREGLVRYLAH
ncbi:MAG: peptidoglycan-binding domain-containing protein, partial [Nannocystaceae bacterium]